MNPTLSQLTIKQDNSGYTDVFSLASLAVLFDMSTANEPRLQLADWLVQGNDREDNLACREEKACWLVGSVLR
ncbi:Hypothetical protein POVR2_LOCUS215 [uncultured virus]|nr:Hypothetical protein POVR2_LOCUS215 [uncultured virus]